MDDAVGHMIEIEIVRDVSNGRRCEPYIYVERERECVCF